MDQPYLTFTQRQLFTHDCIHSEVHEIVMNSKHLHSMWGKSSCEKMDQEKMIRHRKKGLSWKHKRGVAIGSLHSSWDYFLEVFTEEQGFVWLYVILPLPLLLPLSLPLSFCLSLCKVSGGAELLT